MNLKWHLENLGYKYLLRDNNGIQYAFSREQKELLGTERDSYLKKLRILLRLCVKIHILEKTPWDIWDSRRIRLHYPEWENETKKQIQEIYGRLREAKEILLTWEETAVFSLFGDARREQDFLAVVNETNDRVGASEALKYYVYNQELLELLEGKRDSRIYILFEDKQWKRWKCLWEETYGKIGIPVLLEDDGTIRSLRDDMRTVLPASACRLAGERGRFPNPGALVFPNARKASRYYRSYQNVSAVIGYYNTLMTYKFHASVSDVNFFYGVGYKYAGLLGCGFCQWLSRESAEEKLLFCSRDGGIFYQIYKTFFGGDAEYFYVSRRALSEVAFQEYPEEYLDNYWLHRVMNRNRKLHVGEALTDFGLDFMSDRFKDYRIDIQSYLTPELYKRIKRMVLENQDRVREHLEVCRKAGLEYIYGKLAGENTVEVIDLGWHGTTYRYLTRFNMTEKWRKHIQGILLAATDNETVADNINLGRIRTYAFSDDKIRRDKNIGVPLSTKQVFCFEKLFSSPEPSLLHYTYGETGEVELIFKKKNPYSEKIAEIHRGAMDFAKDFMPFIREFGLHIQVEDAWIPMSDFLNNPKMIDSFYKLILQES